MEYQTVVSLVLTNPLFAGLAAAAIVAAGFGFLRWRVDVPFWAYTQLIAKYQYRPATQSEVEGLLTAAERNGKRDFAAARLDDVRGRHSNAPRLGHLWWTWWQVRGLVGVHVPAPACTSRDNGLDIETKGRFDSLPLSDVMKRW